MSNEQEVIRALQQRVGVVERELEDVKKIQQVPGPQGKPGNIAQAVHNAELAAMKIVDEAIAEFKSNTVRRFDNDVKEIQTAFKDLRSHIEATVKQTVESVLVGLLQQYKLLTDKNEPIDPTWLAHRLAEIGK